jgi:hypothetical protein
MRNRILYSVFIVVVAALTMAPAVFGGQDERASQVLAESRKAIGEKKLDALKALSVEAAVVRNINTMQISSDVELLLELPDKYVRTDQPNAPGMIASGMTSGFNGDRPIQPVQGGFAGGGAMVIRMGGPMPPSDAPKLSPEEQAKLEASVVRGQKQELSRFMLGWFAAAHPSLGAQYTFAGEAESPDGRAYVLDVRTADGFAARLFIDQQTSLPLMLTYQGPQRQVVMAGGPGHATAGGGTHGGGAAQGGTVKPSTDEERKRAQEGAQRQVAELQKQAPVMVDYTLYFEDWQPVDGVQFPRKIRRASGGATTEEWTINKVRINPTIDPKKFAVKS